MNINEWARNNSETIKKLHKLQTYAQKMQIQSKYLLNPKATKTIYDAIELRNKITNSQFIKQYYSLQEQFRPILENANKMRKLVEFFNPKISWIYEYRNKIPEINRNIHDELSSKFGWYLYNLSKFTFGEIKQLQEIMKREKTNDIKEYIKSIDDAMNNLVDNDSDEIIKNITEISPERSRIINDAYKAHKNELYTLSIPVMLTQIDGISSEILGKSIFSKDRKSQEPVSKRRLERLFKESSIDKDEEKLMYSFLYYPLEVLSVIVLDTINIKEKYEKNEVYSQFNRHGIIHGLDTNYYDKTNSNKCIALLGYLYNLKIALENDIEKSKQELELECQ